MTSTHLILTLLLSLLVAVQLAPVPSDCYYGGQTYKVGEQFSVANRFVYKCLESYVQYLGCYQDETTIILPLNTNKTIGEYRHECFTIGTQLYYRRTAVSSS